MAMAGVPGMTPAYQPGPAQRKGLFIVLEGISGSGKCTLAVLLAERLGGRHFHTVPAPVSDLRPYISAAARPLPQLAFYLAGALHASDLARDALQHGHAVAGRYVNSVIANHAAAHGLDSVTDPDGLARVGVFLAARRWTGEPVNAEPRKCSEIAQILWGSPLLPLRFSLMAPLFLW
jgi:hypothetical protein